jgi:probable phosphomutase (TIGR03848 family)
VAPEALTTFLLIRHGLHGLGVDAIAGRRPGVRLSPDGRRQADALVSRLEGVRIDALYCSPMERTVETAGPLVARTGVALQICDDLHEIDYGDWTGQRLDELRGSGPWQQWNSFRSGHRAPNGESMLHIQTRVIALLMRLREEHRGECVALVSHGDVIKAAVAYCLGVPLDLFQRIEISPASISVIVIGDFGPHVLCTNNTAGPHGLPPLDGG